MGNDNSKESADTENADRETDVIDANTGNGAGSEAPTTKSGGDSSPSE